MKLLIDTDYICYKGCAAAEDEIDWGDDVIMVVSRFSEAMRNVERDLAKIKQEFMWDTPELILFFSDSKNFQKKIYPDYKGHRNRKKPCGYRRVISELSKQYEVVRMADWKLMMLWVFMLRITLAILLFLLTKICAKSLANFTILKKQ